MKDVAGKLFEVVAMIPENTQRYGGEIVPAGPALRDADGKEHVKPEGGCFPPTVATEGMRIRVQDAQASRKEDRVSILNHIVQSLSLIHI